MKKNVEKDMKMFYWKLLLMQTLLYGLLGLMHYSDGLSKDGKLLWVPFVTAFYVISVVCTFFIPMIKLYLKQK